LPFAPFWEIWVFALIGTLVEALPLPEFDNLAIPVAVSLTALVLGYIHPV
jgi:dolichol kinase